MALPAVAADSPTPEDRSRRLPRSLRVSYEIGDGLPACPREAFFHTWVTSNVVALKDVFDDGATATLTVTVTHEKDGYHGRADVHDETGTSLWQRELPPTFDCATLVSTLAVVFKVRWLFPLPLPTPPAEPEAPPSPAPPCPTCPTCTACPTCGPKAPCPAPPHRPATPVCNFSVAGYCPFMDVTLGISAAALITANYTSDVGPGVALGVEVQGKMWSVAFEGRGLFDSRIVANEPIDPAKPYEPGREGSVGVFSALLVPCFRYSYFMGCVVAGAGVGGAQGSGQGDVGFLFPWAAVGPRLGAEIPFAERFAVRGFAEALYLPTEGAVRFGRSNVKWTQPLVSAYFGAALAVTFK